MHTNIEYPQIARVTYLVTTLFLAACSGSATTNSVATTTTNTSAAPMTTSIGTDFFLALPDHICVSDPASCRNTAVSNKLIIASASATSGEVVFNGVTTPFSVSAGGVTEILLDAGVVLTANESVESKGIHVTAVAPVSVHVVSENALSADGYLALPTISLGSDYRVMSFASTRYNGSEFAIVATQNSTTVTITPTANGSSKLAGTAFTVSLNLGETYQFQNPAYADLTGTHITSDKPIAVLSGHRCVDIPAYTGYCDYLVEQIPDVTLWGKTFHTSLFSGRTKYNVRILASQDGTTISTQPAGLANGTLNAGQYMDIELSDSAEFISSNPVLVAQYMRGFADDSAAKGDPSMVLISPAELGMTDTTFGVYALAGSNGSYLNVVAETSSLTNLKLDNVAVNTTLFTPMGGSSLYSVATLPVTSGSHTLQGTSPYTALVYDYGTTWNAVSYAYPVSSKLTFASATSTTTPTTVCEEDDDHDKQYKYLHHHRRHHHKFKQGEYCPLHHLIHKHIEEEHDECLS